MFNSLEKENIAVEIVSHLKMGVLVSKYLIDSKSIICSKNYWWSISWELLTVLGDNVPADKDMFKSSKKDIRLISWMCLMISVVTIELLHLASTSFQCISPLWEKNEAGRLKMHYMENVNLNLPFVAALLTLNSLNLLT